MISIIIPTYNEAQIIDETLNRIQLAISGTTAEIIVVDGGSSDDTISIALAKKVTVILSNRKGRSIQMNKGAEQAKGQVLYFLHADSRPPEHFTKYILQAINEGAVSGCFRLAFDHDHWFLKANCWFTKFNVNAVRFGDQSLFVMKDIFHKCKGFREDLCIMEDQEIIHRIKKHGKFKVMEATVTTSARKYLQNGIYRMQAIFYRIWMLYYLGYPQEYLVEIHRKLIRENKL